jgi:glycosyltransferase involved in cell wall biosynthesis
MTAPYASIVIPTFDRAATLPFALASIQAQSERSLEILVVLDGATAACRDIALAAASNDPRVVVLDLPKDSRAARYNVDVAVSRARAQRIFYSDDDDLLLPSHVTSLGPLLDQADVADSRVCSVDRKGALHLGPCRACSPRMREILCQETRLKLIYDTHIAHRRDAYPRLSSWVSGPGNRPAVWDFLAGFAADPECRWTSCDSVTALSVHGAARRDMSVGDRRNEIAKLSARIPSIGANLARADSVFHLFRLLIVDPPGGATGTAYLALRGAYQAELADNREKALFALFSDGSLSEAEAIELALVLAEPVEAGYMFESIAFAFFNAFGVDRHEEILKEAARREGANRAARLAAYSAALCRSDLLLARDVAIQAAAIGPDDALGSLARWCQRLQQIIADHSPNAHPSG